MKHKNIINWSIPAAFFAVVIVSYGIYIFSFGLYGDDWIYLWNYHLLGSGSFANFVASDRPYSAWIYFLTSSIFGEQVWLYHLYVLVIRFLSVYVFWKILNIIWPEKRFHTTAIALIFAIYPGFGQHPIALQFLLHFSVLLLFLLSLYFMLLACVSTKRRFLYLIISLVSAFNIFSLEYFVGLELLRPVFLFLVLKRKYLNKKQLFGQVGLNWLPYLAINIFFVIWRTFIYQFRFYTPKLVYEIEGNSTNAIKNLVLRIIQDLKTVNYNAWRQIFNFSEYPIMIILLLIFGLFFIISMYMYFLKQNAEAKDDKLDSRWSLLCIGIGMFALFIAGWPFWITNLPVEVVFPWDRSTLPFMIGSSMLIIGSLNLFVRPKVQFIFVGVIVSLAIGWHYQNAMIYKNEWKNLRTYFTQLAWRVPDLEEGTIVISEDIPLYRYSDNDLTAPLNWMYAPEHKSEEMKFRYFDLTTRKDTILPNISKNISINHGYRSLSFKSSSDHIINIFYRPPGCLWVLDADDDYYPELPQQLKDMLVLSNFDQIVSDAEPMQTLPSVFGNPVEKDWCYYFETADLARQNKDWQKVVDIAEESDQKGFEPYYYVEYLPFLEGYANSGYYEEAVTLSNKIIEDNSLHSKVCEIWENVSNNNNYDEEEIISIKNYLHSLSCN